MASVAIGQVLELQPGALLTDCVAAHGSRSHPYAASPELLNGPAAARNLADAIHLLCTLHGRHPGVVELVAMRSLEPEARAWLGHASEAFARERTLLARLAVAAGPIPPTPGVGGESASATMRNALMTLAQSERRGCAMGAVFALLIDWSVIRSVLGTAAERFTTGMTPAWTIGAEEIREVADRVSKSVAIRRAMLFGAEQVSLQHRGLWDLLYARARARAG